MSNIFLLSQIFYQFKNIFANVIDFLEHHVINESHKLYDGRKEKNMCQKFT